MRLGARIKAASEVLDEIFERHRPASSALSDWGKAHRFAGSGDRNAIGTLVYDVLRKRHSLGAQMDSGSTRSLVLAGAMGAYGLDAAHVTALADGSDHCLAPLSDEEAALLAGARGALVDAALHIQADIPEWIMPSFLRAFGDRAVVEGRAMAERAPVDMRANTLKASRDKVLKALEPFGAVATQFSPTGVRIAAPIAAAKSPHVEGEQSHGKGWFEVQDEGSQIAAYMSGAKPGKQVLDLCAGAGGKTLALCAIQDNKGQVFAYDSDKRQLRPIFDRLSRAGVRNIQVIDGGDEVALSALGPRFDAVLVDAPCTGSGTWRRRPDSKWRLSPENIAERQSDQRAVLTVASRMVKPGGRVTYVTCSVLPEENGDQVAWFLETYPQFRLLPYGEVWRECMPGEPPVSADGQTGALLLSPATHQTDGFFIATFQAQ